MTYAIIKVAGKQYRVREGERLLVDRLREDDGATFTPSVLLVGGDGEPLIAPGDVKVTARVLGAARGPKIRIGKYKKRTGYRRHTGFRASLTQIEIESIGGKRARTTESKRREEKPVATKSAPAATAPAEQTAAAQPASGVPEGYADMTIAELKAAVGEWSLGETHAALAFEQENAKRKGAIAALEAAIAETEGEG
ncbi:MAG TPA: 50S ribosomal protein L21 [Gaiellaceae bacterium]|nr:50S ribosomal protein L21 [Gaiellaceae bacterium]